MVLQANVGCNANKTVSMKMIDLANEQTLVLGISDEMEPCTYMFHEKDYSAVEGIMIITTFLILT